MVPSHHGMLGSSWKKVDLCVLTQKDHHGKTEQCINDENGFMQDLSTLKTDFKKSKWYFRKLTGVTLCQTESEEGCWEMFACVQTQQAKDRDLNGKEREKPEPFCRTIAKDFMTDS